MENLCGKCSICCSTHRIDKAEIYWKDEDKAPGEVCEKLIDGQCSAYKDRPTTCKKYECLWRQLVKTKNEYSVAFRPDNLGVVVDTYYHEKSSKFVFAIKEIKPGKFNLHDLDPALDILLKGILELSNKQKGTCVVIAYQYGKNTGATITLK